MKLGSTLSRRRAKLIGPIRQPSLVNSEMERDSGREAWYTDQAMKHVRCRKRIDRTENNEEPHQTN